MGFPDPTKLSSTRMAATVFFWGGMYGVGLLHLVGA